jgi:predicted Rossmann fold nucleotide-binding protein DprA/Smf involved in DNA uptake
MQPEAAYWALLTGEGQQAARALADLVDAWHGAGNRSVRGLFEQAPEALAMLLGLNDEALAPLLALRPRVPQTVRLMEKLGREGVDLVTWWERRYPRVLKGSLGGTAPPVLWYAGSLDLLAGRPVAVFGGRDAGAEAIEFARALAAAVAGQGHPVITGVARVIERATLEAVLGADGTAIVVLGQGIARAQPDLRRLGPRIQDGKLLVLARLAPEVAWQPWLEESRGTLAVALAERVAVAQVSEGGGTWATVQAACRLGRPLYVRQSEAEAHMTLVAQGGIAVPWPGEQDELVRLALPAPVRQLREAAAPSRAEAGLPETDGPAMETDREARAAADEQPDAAEIDNLEEALLRYLQRARRRAIGKGALLQVFPVREAALDRALVALITGGRVVQRPHRSGAGYAAVRDGQPEIGPSAFQMSLFGQEE